MIEGAAFQARADRVFQQEIVRGVGFRFTRWHSYSSLLQAWYERMRTRPIMTGGYLKPTFFNKPLPRLLPQPLHITGMISARRKVRQRRLDRYDALQNEKAFLDFESNFEHALAANAGSPFERVYSDELINWRMYIPSNLFVLHA